MRKSLLFFIFAVACGIYASAQLYTIEAYTEDMTDYWEGYDLYINVPDPITVDVYDSYVVVHKWLGDNAAQDLKVSFDADSTVTSITPITSGIEGDTYTSGYASFSTKSPAYYYAQIYVDEEYCYAWADDSFGYVILSGYFYRSSTDFDWALYYLMWDKEAESLMYTTTAHCAEYPDWADMGTAFIPANDVTIDVYPDHMLLMNWAGGNGHDLYITYNNFSTITSVTPVVNDVYGETFNEGTTDDIATGSEPWTSVKLQITEGTAFAEANNNEGYVMLYGQRKNAAQETENFYYYLPFTSTPDGITGVDVDNAAPVEYYNMQGIRLADPTPGQIVIKRQGATSTKLIIR